MDFNSFKAQKSGRNNGEAGFHCKQHYRKALLLLEWSLQIIGISLLVFYYWEIHHLPSYLARVVHGYDFCQLHVIISRAKSGALSGTPISHPGNGEGGRGTGDGGGGEVGTQRPRSISSDVAECVMWKSRMARSFSGMRHKVYAFLYTSGSWLHDAHPSVLSYAFLRVLLSGVRQ